MDGTKKSLEDFDLSVESPDTTVVGIVEPPPPKLPDALVEALNGYRVIRKISEHPGSIVFKAEDQDAGKLVIVKVVDGNPDRAAEFPISHKLDIERLKHMRHPCLASIVDIGTTSDGQHFFVSEAIRGQAMLEFAKTHHLSVEERIKLFVKVCSAVERLHQNGIVHRDLRPSNILIGARGEPRLTGVGVASLTDFDLGFPMGQVSPRESRIFYTYRSPEQVRGVGLDVDTRSDVYVLGVLLFELLTNQPPYDVEVEGNSEIFKVISEVVPECGELESAKWPRGVKSVLMKALEKVPDKRYQSVGAMILDLTHAIGDRSGGIRVGAGQSGVAPIVLLAAAMFMLAVGAFAAGALLSPGVREMLPAKVQAMIPPATTVAPTLPPVRIANPVSEELKKRAAELEAAQLVAAEQRDLAIRKRDAEKKRRLAVEEESQRLAATIGKLQSEIGQLSEKVTSAQASTDQAADISRFLVNIFGLHATDELSLRSPSAIDLLDAANKEALRRFAKDPKSLATVLSHLGAAYGGLGAHGKGVELLRRALAIRQKELGDNDSETISLMNDLAAQLYNQGELAEGEPICRQLVELSSKSFGNEDERTLTAVNNLAQIEYGLGKLDEAEKNFRRAMKGRKKVFGEGDARTATTTYQLAVVLFERGKLAKAEPFFRKALKTFEKTLPSGHSLISTARSSLGGIMVSLGRFDEAEPFLLKSYEQLKATVGPDHPTSRATINRIISMYTLWNKPGEAAKWRERVGRVTVSGPES